MRIAIPKGRLQSDVLATFAAAGYDISPIVPAMTALAERARR